MRIVVVAAFVGTTCLTAHMPARSLQTTELFGVYGYVHRVVREPGASNPTRIQVWGVFSVAVPGSTADYHAPERGYLYFELPADGAATTREEWAELIKLGDAREQWSGKPPAPYAGVVAFTGSGARPRVRTSNERAQQPDPYRAGKGIVRMRTGDGTAEPSALVMLRSLLLDELWMNYGIVDKVTFEPNETEPERVHICGAFAIGTEFGGYAPAQRGCLLVTFPDSASGNLVADIRDEWTAWRTVANTGQIVGFVSLAGKPTVRLRPADERQPFAADPYNIRIDWSVVRPDSNYAPVQALLKLHRL